MTEPSHLVAGCELHEFAPSWVRCSCGERLDGPCAEAVRLAFENHRRGMALEPVSLSRILGSRRRLSASLARRDDLRPS